MTIHIRPIKDQRLSDQAIHQLLLLIRSGQVQVGGKLPPEGSLALQLGISRGILREALTVLEARGFVKRTPREGTTILRKQEDNLAQNLAFELKKASMMELLEFRESMECKVVERVIQRATDQEIEELQALLSQQHLTAPSKDYYFHYRLALLSGNSLFVSFIDTYYGLIEEIRGLSLQVEHRQAQITKEHQRIARALKNRSIPAARRAVKAHLAAASQLIKDIQPQGQD